MKKAGASKMSVSIAGPRFAQTRRGAKRDLRGAQRWRWRALRGARGRGDRGRRGVILAEGAHGEHERDQPEGSAFEKREAGQVDGVPRGDGPAETPCGDERAGNAGEAGEAG